MDLFYQKILCKDLLVYFHNYFSSLLEQLLIRFCLPPSNSVFSSLPWGPSQQWEKAGAEPCDTQFYMNFSFLIVSVKKAN